MVADPLYIILYINPFHRRDHRRLNVGSYHAPAGIEGIDVLLLFLSARFSSKHNVFARYKVGARVEAHVRDGAVPVYVRQG